MHRDERLTYALTAGTAAAVGHTLITDARPRDTLAGVALCAAAAEYFELAQPSASPAASPAAGPRQFGPDHRRQR